VKAERPPGCVFCDALAHEDGEANWVVRRETLAFVILNIYPYNSGHVMVCPTRHSADLSDLSAAESAALFSLATRADRALRTAMRAEGVNLGANLGRAAGGSIDHVHLHLVPRWTGDTNFMPVCSETKVMVQMLTETYRILSTADWGAPPA
jgi:ATP adenylyltransferase